MDLVNSILSDDDLQLVFLKVLSNRRTSRLSSGLETATSSLLPSGCDDDYLACSLVCRRWAQVLARSRRTIHVQRVEGLSPLVQQCHHVRGLDFSSCRTAFTDEEAKALSKLLKGAFPGLQLRGEVAPASGGVEEQPQSSSEIEPAAGCEGPEAALQKSLLTSPDSSEGRIGVVQSPVVEEASPVPAHGEDEAWAEEAHYLAARFIRRAGPRRTYLQRLLCYFPRARARVSRQPSDLPQPTPVTPRLEAQVPEDLVLQLLAIQKLQKSKQEVPSVCSLSLAGTSVKTDGLLSLASCFPYLEHVNLGSLCLSWPGFLAVCQTGRLCSLSLPRCGASERAADLILATIWRFCSQSLTLLDLTAFSITINGLESLFGLQHHSEGIFQEVLSKTGPPVSLLNPGLPALSKLSLANCTAVDDTGLGLVAKHCPRITSLDISGLREATNSGLISLGASLKQLSHLTVSQGCCYNDEGLIHLAAASSLGLFSLRVTARNGTVSWNTGSRQGALRQVQLRLQQRLAVPPGATRVRAEGGICMDAEAASAIAAYCPHLEHLELYDCLSLTNDSLRALAGGCSKLRCLKLEECSEVSSEGLGALASACHDSLQELQLIACPNLDNQGLGNLARCTQLRVLEIIARNEHLGDAGLVALAESCSLLEVLRLEGSQGNRWHVGDLAVAAFLANCPCLQELYLTQCQRVTEEAFRGENVACRGQLEVLELRNVNLNHEGLMLIAKNFQTGLRQLVIQDCPMVSDSDCLWIAVCQRLSRLAVEKCPRVSDAGLEILARNGGQGLRYASFKGCKVTQAGAEVLLQRVPAVALVLDSDIKSLVLRRLA